MKVMLFLLCLSIIPLYTCEGSQKPPLQIDFQQLFESTKASLPTDLQTFVSNFETWSKEDKAKIKIEGLNFIISGLDAAKHASYDNNIGYWIDSHTQTTPQRIVFLYCLQHLQEQD